MSVNRKKISEYVRFSLAQRVEHFVLILSFSLLGLTGLPQKYPLSPISQGLVGLLGGVETLRVIHRVAATVFLIEAIYHIVVVGYKLFVRREQASMVPTVKDGKDAIQAFQYNLGMRKDAPRMPRYNFTEKAEYWAMIWGLLVMAVTGFMLWNPIATTNLLPGEFIPAAKVAHGGEAVLAVLAIILWHFYHVHIRHFNKSMFTGKMDRHSMDEEHGAELDAIESGRVHTPPPAPAMRQRMTIFVPIAAITSLVLLAGVYWFVTFEESAITTIPREQQPQAFVPQTPTIAPPTATPKPTQPAEAGVVVWTAGVDNLFQNRCASCHGSIPGFKADSYETVMQSVEPGNPEGSIAYTVQEQGGHPGQFTDQELAMVRAWIEGGALEQSEGGEAAGGQTGGADTFASLEPLFQSQCSACHGSVGGFNAESYDEVMKAVTPGDAEGSSLVQVQRAGHPGMFQPEDLERIINWITAGAPQ